MVEVFKTNVMHPEQAEQLLAHIHSRLADCLANFDLADCDRILRIQSSGYVDAEAVIALLSELGFAAEVLPDEVVTVSRQWHPVLEYLSQYN